MNRMTDKVAVVTGGGSGFGAGIARQFCDEGARVVLLDLNQEAAESIAKELGETCLPVYADISDKSNLSSAIDQIIDWSGKIDILVNNGGVGQEHTPL